jgi:glucose/arabinose dehydrogenase
MDGSVPADNPLTGRADARPEIWSWGHRNVQGAALHPQTGELWTHEHGPQGGDEINRTRAGLNYGWPEVTYGREYVTGRKIGAGEAREGVEPPVLQFTPSIAPSGMAFYTGDVFPQWKGNLFVGALKFQLVARVVLEGDRVVHEERLFAELGRRIRDVRQGPDGHLWLVDETEGRILRLDPA